MNSVKAAPIASAKKRRADRIEAVALEPLQASGRRYRLQALRLTIGHNYRIFNDSDELQYVVNQVVLAPVKRLWFEDVHGVQLVYIRDKFLAVRSRFELLRNDVVEATIRQRYLNVTWVKHTVRLANGDEMETRRGPDCRVLCRGEHAVGLVSSHPSGKGMQVLVSPTEDQVLVLATFVSINEFLRGN